MNRVLKIERDRVTVQPGISLTELADILSDEGLELIGGFDLASRTVGGAVCGRRPRSVDGRRRRPVRLARPAAEGLEPERQEVRRQREDEEPARADAFELRPARRRLRGHAARAARARLRGANGEGVVQGLRQARREAAERDGRREALSAAVPRPHLPRAAPSRRRRRSGPQVRVAPQGLGRVLGAARGRALDRHGRADSPDPLSA